MTTELKQIDEYRWEVPKTGPMRVPGIVYSSASMLEAEKQKEPLKYENDEPVLLPVFVLALAC